jgi:hypothetical protein
MLRRRRLSKGIQSYFLEMSSRSTSYRLASNYVSLSFVDKTKERDECQSQRSYKQEIDLRVRD